MISKNDTPFERVSDLLLNLYNTKSNIEKVLEDESEVDLIDCDLFLKPAYEYPPGRRKEEMMIKDYNHHASEEYSYQEREMFQNKFRKRGSILINKEQKVFGNAIADLTKPFDADEVLEQLKR